MLGVNAIVTASLTSVNQRLYARVGSNPTSGFAYDVLDVILV